MDIAFHINRFKSKITDLKIRKAIKNKWAHDLRMLPLTPEHWELYVIIHKLCLRELGEFPDLINCRDFNDRIQWLKLFDQDAEIVRCSDKIKVRDYVRERVGDDYLNDIYQVHNHFDEIDFDALPNAFVVKTNHDSGTVLLVRDKSTFDRKAARERIDRSLKHVYGWQNGEWAYSYIKPQVLVEEFINPQLDKPPADYKFHCVNGEVAWLQYIFDRGQDTKECIVDINGIATFEHFDQNMQHSEVFSRPIAWEKLLACARKLSNGFKYVRVDLFERDGHISVGELTFYPLMGCYKTGGQRRLGQLLDFDRSTYKPFLIPTLEKQQSRFDLYPEA